MQLQTSLTLRNSEAVLLPGIDALPQLHREIFVLVQLLYKGPLPKEIPKRLERLDELLALLSESCRLEESLLRHRANARARDHCVEHRQILFAMRVLRGAFLLRPLDFHSDMPRALDALVIHTIVHDHSFAGVAHPGSGSKRQNRLH